MAEAEIKIRVTAKGDELKAVNAEFRNLQAAVKDADYQFRQGKINATQLKGALSDVEKESKKLNLSYKQQVDLNASVQQVTWRAQAGFKSLALSLRDVQGAIGGRGGAGLASSLPNLAQDFIALRASTGSAVLAFRAMATQLLGPAGIVLAISLVTSAITLFLSSSKEEKKAVEDVTGALKEQKELREQILEQRRDLGLITDKQYRVELEQQLSLLEVELERLATRQKLLMPGAGPAPGSGQPLSPQVASQISGSRQNLTGPNPFQGQQSIPPMAPAHIISGTITKEEELLDVESKILALRKKLKGISGGDKRGGDTSFDAMESGIAGRQARMQGKLLASKMRGTDFRAETFGFDADKSKKEFKGFERSFLAGTDAMVTAIHPIGQAFAEMFGGAGTLLGAFAQNFINTMTSLASNYAIGSLLGAIGGPFAAIGAALLGGGKAGGGPVSSGRPYVVGEKGPELFVPNRGGSIVSNGQYRRLNNMTGGGGSGGGMQTVQVVGVLHGNDMRLMNAKSNLARRGRLM